MAGKLVRGILDAVEEKLLPKAAARAEGRSLATSGIKATKSPVRGLLSRELTKDEVHPDIWNAAFGEPLPSNYAPLWRQFHGTNSRTPFDFVEGDRKDVGISLTPSPDVSDFHALGRYDWSPDAPTPPLGAPGPRVYPLLVDPGKTYPFPADAKMWATPGTVINKTINSPDFDPSAPYMSDILRELSLERPLPEALQERGFDSITYPHDNPWDFKRAPDGSVIKVPARGKGLTVFDPTRVVPEWSEVGQRAGKVRGVLAAEESPIKDKTTEKLIKTYGSSGTPDELLEFLYHPITSRIGMMDELGQTLGGASTKEEIRELLDEVGNLARSMSNGAIDDAIVNINYVYETLKEMGSKNASTAGRMMRELGKVKASRR